MNRLVALLKIIEVVQVFFYLPAVAWVALGFALRLRVQEVRLGVGPRKIGFRLGGTFISLGLLPLGCFVKYDDDGPGSIYALSGPARAVLHLSGPLLCALAAFAILGREAQAALLGAIPRFFEGALFRHEALAVWRALLGQDPVACAGYAAAATAALNLLPPPPLPGGLALFEGFAPSRPGEAPAWKLWLLNGSVVLLFACLVNWTIALVQALVA